MARARRRLYLQGMPLPRPASPRALIADVRAFARERSGIQWGAAIVAIAMPVVLVLGFITDAKTNIVPKEQIVFVHSWGSNRTDAEIKADQARREQRREAAAVERQRQFKKLEKRLGMDGG